MSKKVILEWSFAPMDDEFIIIQQQIVLPDSIYGYPCYVCPPGDADIDLVKDILQEAAEDDDCIYQIKMIDEDSANKLANKEFENYDGEFCRACYRWDDNNYICDRSDCVECGSKVEA